MIALTCRATLCHLDRNRGGVASSIAVRPRIDQDGSVVSERRHD